VGEAPKFKTNSDLPWLVLGDFNEVLWQEEHLSCTPRPTSQMEAFREVLHDCHLTDLGFSGVPYTYDGETRKYACTARQSGGVPCLARPLC
jgi:hypothetical protein